MKTCFRPSGFVLNIACDPQRVARAMASLRLYTRRVSSVRLEIIDIIPGSYRSMLVVSVSVRSRTPLHLGDILTEIAALRTITLRPVTECSICFR